MWDYFPERRGFRIYNTRCLVKHTRLCYNTSVDGLVLRLVNRLRSILITLRLLWKIVMSSSLFLSSYIYPNQMTLIQLPIVLNQRIPDFTSEEELRCK